jgi:hypothetical protein
MKAAKRLLWIQLCLGAFFGFIAASYIHWGAMSAAWAYGLQKEFEKMQAAPGFQMPAPIRDQSVGKILSDMEAYGHARADVAFYWMVACVGAALFAAIMLWCIGQKSNQPLQATAAPPRD